MYDKNGTWYTELRASLFIDLNCDESAVLLPEKRATYLLSLENVTEVCIGLNYKMPTHRLHSFRLNWLTLIVLKCSTIEHINFGHKCTVHCVYINYYFCTYNACILHGAAQYM